MKFLEVHHALPLTVSMLLRLVKAPDRKVFLLQTDVRARLVARRIVSAEVRDNAGGTIGTLIGGYVLNTISNDGTVKVNRSSISLPFLYSSPETFDERWTIKKDGEHFYMMSEKLMAKWKPGTKMRHVDVDDLDKEE